MTAAGHDRRLAFIRANTRLTPPSLVPEITLHLADEAMDLWQMTAQELDAAELAPPFWAFAWAGGQAVARHLLDQPHLVAKKSVLVVAAGSGIEAIAATMAGAGPVTASDIDPFAVAAMQLNAAANAVAFTATADDYLAEATPPAADVVLLGDLCYEQKLAEKLMSFARAAAKAGAVVLLGDPGRSYVPRTGLTALASYDVPTSRAIEDADLKRATVWRVHAEES